MSLAAGGVLGLLEVLGVLGASTAGTYELQERHASVRTPLALSRRVGVVGVSAGSGTSTVAAALAGLLARRRDAMVLGVDASGGGLAGRLGVETPPAADREAATVRSGARTAEQARRGLPVSGTGLHVLDLTAPEQRWPTPVPRWTQLVSPVARFYDLVVTDWGARPWAADLTDATATSHVVVLVARADRSAALEAAACLPLLRTAAGGPRAVLVLVDRGRTSDRVAVRLQTQLGIPVVVVGHDRALSAEVLDSRALDLRARRTHLRLAQQVVQQAVLSALPAARREP